MPGIPVLDIDKRNLDDNFFCEYCGSLLRDATRASCGHFFCSSCVDNRFRKNPGGVSYCPKTMRPLFYYEFSFAEDKFCDELHNITVHCLFLSVGCPWTGTLHNLELHYSECRAFPVVLGKCGKDGNHQGKKEELNNSTLSLSRKLNLLPAYNDVGVTEQIAPSVKELTSGNADIQSASSYYFHEQRLNNIENKLAQYDLLVEENIRLKQDVQRLTEAFFDLKSKVDHIEQGLANALKKIDYDNFLGSLNALNIEQINLRAQLNR